MQLDTEILKILASKHFTKTPRPKVGLAKLAEALGRLGVPGVAPEQLIEPLLTLKGRGFANTDPKIIMKEEFPQAEFTVWATPLGLTELGKRMEGGGAAAPAPATPAKPAAAAKPAAPKPPGAPPKK